ncbi:MAG: formylglycine-generating enzyme family protein [Pseudomonadota bacterium]
MRVRDSEKVLGVLSGKCFVLVICFSLFFMNSCVWGSPPSNLDGGTSESDGENTPDDDSQQDEDDSSEQDAMGECGNGVVEGEEHCDGNNLGDKTCASAGFKDGVLKCNADCTLDVLGCTLAWVTVLPGKFTMGSPSAEACRDSDEIQREVTLTRSFEISSTETTQGQFKYLMGFNTSYYSSSGAGDPCGDSCPVEHVSWHVAVAYCNALSTQKGLTQCYANKGNNAFCNEDADCDPDGVCIKNACVKYDVTTEYNGTTKDIYNCPGYRLPTEAEWEYAYRAGTTTPYYNGENDPTKCDTCEEKDTKLDAIAWYCGDCGEITYPVGQKQPNAWGLFDMAGSVYEWCHDWGAVDLAPGSATDPWGPFTGTERALRGGSYREPAGVLRAAKRQFSPPTQHFYDRGFRVVKTK